MATMSNSATQTPCRLLTLPGELRNRIYRLVLVQPKETPIVVTSAGYDRGGGLLRTCKDVRREELKLFYHETSFTHTVRRYDSNPIANFYSSLRNQDLSLSGKTKLELELVDEPCWPNLLQWIRRVHKPAQDEPTVEIGTERLRKENITDLKSHIQCIMFFTAVKLHDQPWDFVEDMLLGMRPSLVIANQRWAEG